MQPISIHKKWFVILFYQVQDGPVNDSESTFYFVNTNLFFLL